MSGTKKAFQKYSLNEHKVHFLDFLLFTFRFKFCIYLFLAAQGLCCWVRTFSTVTVWLVWLSVEQGSLCCSLRASHHGGFSCCEAQALHPADSVVAVRGLNICGTQTYLLLCMWNLPRKEIEPLSPALAGRFLSTVPPGKSHLLDFN